jgi:hypothetical protein
LKRETEHFKPPFFRYSISFVIFNCFYQFLQKQIKPMRYILAFLLPVLLFSCDGPFDRIEGNGVMEEKEKSLQSFDRLEVSGVFKVKLIPSDNHKVIIEADENLQRYILVDQDGDRLKIRMKSNINIKTKKGINITVYMKELSKLELAGSGDVVSEGLFENDDKMEVLIAGSGNADLQVKTPEMKVSIGGSGKVILDGKTRDFKLSIGGSGDFEGENLMSENADISIAGSGSARVFASVDLKVSIAGSGDVFYKGQPNVKKSIAGVGNVKPLE